MMIEQGPCYIALSCFDQYSIEFYCFTFFINNNLLLFPTLISMLFCTPSIRQHLKSYQNSLCSICSPCAVCNAIPNHAFICLLCGQKVCEQFFLFTSQVCSHSSASSLSNTTLYNSCIEKHYHSISSLSHMYCNGNYYLSPNNGAVYKVVHTHSDYQLQFIDFMYIFVILLIFSFRYSTFTRSIVNNEDTQYPYILDENRYKNASRCVLH